MKDIAKGLTQPEIEQFFWNCLVAAKIVDDVPRNTATKACALYAVRKATICYAGKNGVQFASASAIAKKASSGKHWQQSGLIKEHVIPVSIIRERVVGELDATRADAAPTQLLLSGDETQGLTPATVALFQKHSRAWLVGRIVRDLTILAWITPEEERMFDDKAKHGGISLRKRMPIGWTVDHGNLARYASCGIHLSKI